MNDSIETVFLRKMYQLRTKLEDLEIKLDLLEHKLSDLDLKIKHLTIESYLKEPIVDREQFLRGEE